MSFISNIFADDKTQIVNFLKSKGVINPPIIQAIIALANEKLGPNVSMGAIKEHITQNWKVLNANASYTHQQTTNPHTRAFQQTQSNLITLNLRKAKIDSAETFDFIWSTTENGLKQIQNDPDGTMGYKIQYLVDNVPALVADLKQNIDQHPRRVFINTVLVPRLNEAHIPPTPETIEKLIDLASLEWTAATEKQATLHDTLVHLQNNLEHFIAQLSNDPSDQLAELLDIISLDADVSSSSTEPKKSPISVVAPNTSILQQDQ